jgi:hypothetical protein
VHLLLHLKIVLLSGIAGGLLVRHEPGEPGAILRQANRCDR